MRFVFAVLAGVVGVLGIILLTTKRESVRMPDLSPRSSTGAATSEYLNAQKAIEYYRQEIRKKPEVVKNYVELAQIYIQEARITALHHEYFPKAERLLDIALDLDANDVAAMSTRASMYATLHRFEEAKALAERAMSVNPHYTATHCVLIDALVELGEYEEAVRRCDALLAFRPDLRAYVRASYLRELHGDNDGARQAMRMACDAGMAGFENRAWALYNFGKLFLNEGKLDTAEFIFKGILDERPAYAYALSGLAQVRQAQQRYHEAVQFLKQAYQTTPEHGFLEQLVPIYRAMGNEDEVRKAIEAVLKEFADHTNEGWNVDREFAAFCADQSIYLDEALQRAEKEYRRRPKNIDVLDTYAWALFKNGRAHDALSVVERALRLHTKNPTMWYHAAAIRFAVGDTAGARSAFLHALGINPYLKTLLEHELSKLSGLLPPLAVQ